MNNMKSANSLFKRAPGPERCMAYLQGNFTPEELQKHIQDSHDNGGKGVRCSYCRFKGIDSHFESYANFLIHYDQEHRRPPSGPSKLHQQFQGQASQIRSPVVQSPRGNRKPKYLERFRLQQGSSPSTASQVSQRARSFSHGPSRRPQPVDLGLFKDRGRLAQVGPATQTGGSGGMLRKGSLKEAKKH
jgi:hypothetical protein